MGFFGRDETLLALDRAFDTQSIVLLHAYAGSGKTMTVAEFARWYHQTGGLDGGPILFTSFETYKPLERVLDTVEQVFRALLEQNNIQWLAMDTQTRLNVTLQIFKHYPPLWIWDNVEPVNGFPAGTDSAWSETEQRELKTFLQIVTAQTKAKFLLTSRRDERAWLGDLPRRVVLPSMPMQERVQLARALAEKHGRRITDVEDWRPLLAFTQGNPLTITVLVGQALRDDLKTKHAIREFVEKLRQGEASFTDETSEGRSKSLGASLSYGFESAFSEAERKILALLHFFQGFVEVLALQLMAGDPSVLLNKQDWHLPELANLQRATFNKLLDKAADIGLLIPHGGGFYTIHPALPWFFRALFEQYYSAEVPPSSSFILPPSSLALRGYVESVGQIGNYYHDQYERGNRDVIAELRAEEANLLRARSLARQNEWWDALTSAMQGLHTLYDHTGRRAEWQRLVEEIIPDFVGANDQPLSGREEEWSTITQYRVRLAMEARKWDAAERLQRLQVDIERRKAAPLLVRPLESLDANEKNVLRTLGVSLHELGRIQRGLGQQGCVQSYQEAAEIAEQIGDTAAAAIAAFNLGHAYKDLPALRDLDQAECSYKHSLELRAERDRRGKGGCMVQLGYVAWERFRDAQKDGKTKNELAHYLITAADYYQQALLLLPPDAVNDLAMTYRNLGNLYDDMGDVENSLRYSNQSIQYSETEGNLYQAGETRCNVAIILANNGRISDALLYARAALRNFEPYGQGAAEQIEKTKGLIGEIEGLMAK